MKKTNLQYEKPKTHIEDKKFRNIYGIDLASKDDYFAVVVHQLPPYETELYKDNMDSYLPRLKTLRQYTRTTYPKMMRMLKEELFKRFPPFYIVPDYTSEKTFTDYLIEEFEKKSRNMVEPINFNNASKKMLKEDGLNVMAQGYQFPNPEQIPSIPATVAIKEWLRTLDNQLRHEQVLSTASNKITFDHPEGEHNDLAIAWELSVHGCLRFMLKPVTGHHLTTSNGKVKKQNPTDHRELFSELYNNPAIRIKQVTGMDVKPRKKSFKRRTGF